MSEAFSPFIFNPMTVSSTAPGRLARDILSQYPLIGHNPVIVPLRNAGGFSGAAIWRVEGSAGRFCLRAWPPGRPTPQRLRMIHVWLRVAAEAALDFVPRVIEESVGGTSIEYDGRLWEVTTWMPGQADYRASPSPARLEAACLALAQLHRAWEQTAAATGICPAIIRRLECVRDWNALVGSGWRPLNTVPHEDPVRPWAERAWPILQARIPAVPGRLADWVTREMPLQACLCDVWHDHVLFTGNAVTGLIDFGGAKVDHVAIDLARLLGSMVHDDAEAWAAGLKAYAGAANCSSQDVALIRALHETGTVLGAASWLMWLYKHQRPFDDRTAVARRLRELVEQMERWHHRHYYLNRDARGSP